MSNVDLAFVVVVVVVAAVVVDVFNILLLTVCDKLGLVVN